MPIDIDIDGPYRQHHVHRVVRWFVALAAIIVAVAGFILLALP